MWHSLGSTWPCGIAQTYISRWCDLNIDPLVGKQPHLWPLPWTSMGHDIKSTLPQDVTLLKACNTTCDIAWSLYDHVAWPKAYISRWCILDIIVTLSVKSSLIYDLLFIFLIVCFTSYFLFSIAVLPHSPGIVYYHLLLRWETRIPGVAPFSFRIGICDLFVHRGQKSYTPTAFGKLWTTPEVRCMKHASS